MDDRAGESVLTADTGVVKAAVFGAFDGIVTILGAVFTLAATPHALLLSGAGLAASGAVSMGGGQLLSDNRNGWRASAAIGATTGAGTLIPVAPYLLWRGLGAGVVSGLLCAAVAALIVWLKSADDPGLSARRAAVQTYSLLLAAAVATALCAWATGAVG